MKDDEFSKTVFLSSPEATDDLGKAFAGALRRGDTLLLEGPIGAGKTHLARAIILARLGRAEDVPSPSFTLVQVYGDGPEIWHADLYRLSHPDEVAELGLEDAFDHAICLVEWPDRLGALRPRSALTLRLVPREDGRELTMSGDALWAPRIKTMLAAHLV